jgi:hypothetical protein
MEEGELWDAHMRLFLQWLNLLSECDKTVRKYKEQEDKFLACLARDVWDVWRTKQNNGLNLFDAMHSKCAHGHDYTKCKHITMTNEKDVILMLTRMSKTDAYATEVLQYADSNPDCYKAPSKVPVKQMEKVLVSYANEMIRGHMRMAIWKEHLSQPMTVLESFLCCSEGLHQLGVSCVPNLWSMYMKLKNLTIHCYRRMCCRHCGNKNGKLRVCGNCRCVYFCAHGQCARRSHDDAFFGHTAKECQLFISHITTRGSASDQTLAEGQKTPRMPLL